MRLLTYLLSFGLAFSTFAAEKFIVDAKQSTVSWSASKVGGTHTGKVSVKSGELDVEGTHLSGGKIEVDMTSISNDDVTDPTWNKKLVDHLKSPDFFNVDANKTAGLMIKNTIIEKGGKIGVNGVLTIKGMEKPITFQVELKREKNQVKGSTTFKFNRLDYDIKYNSKKFFDPVALGDKLIHDEVELTVNIVANKS